MNNFTVIHLQSDMYNNNLLRNYLQYMMQAVISSCRVEVSPTALIPHSVPLLVSLRCRGAGAAAGGSSAGASGSGSG